MMTGSTYQGKEKNTQTHTQTQHKPHKTSKQIDRHQQANKQKKKPEPQNPGKT